MKNRIPEQKYVCGDDEKTLSEIQIFQALQTGELKPDSMIRKDSETIAHPLYQTPLAESFPVLSDYFASYAKKIKLSLWLYLLSCAAVATIFILNDYSITVLFNKPPKLFLSFCALFILAHVFGVRQIYFYLTLMPRRRFISPFWLSLLYLIPGLILVFGFPVIIPPANNFRRQVSKFSGAILRRLAWITCILTLLTVLSYPFIVRFIGRSIDPFEAEIARILLRYIPFLPFVLYLFLFTTMSLCAKKIALEYKRNIDELSPSGKSENIYAKELCAQKTSNKRRIAALCLIPVAAYLLPWYMSVSGFEATVADMHSKGFIFSYQELHAEFGDTITEEEKVTLSIIALKIKEAWGELYIYNIHPEGFSEEQIKTYKEAFIKHRELLELIESKLPQYETIYMPIDWETLSNDSFKFLQLFRSIAQIYSIRAEIALQEQNKDELLHSLNIIAQARDAIGDNTASTVESIRRSIENLRISQLQKLAFSGLFNQLTDDDLRNLIRESQDAERKLKKNIPFSIRTDIVIDYQHLLRYPTMPDKYLRLGNVNEIMKLYARLYMSSPVGFYDKTCWLKKMEQFYEESTLDFYQISITKEKTSQYRFLRPMSSGFLGRIKTYSLIYAKERTIAATLSAELYRRKYGNLPETLSQLVPEFLDSVPIDPFNGKELRFKSGIFTYEFPKLPNSRHNERNFQIIKGFGAYSVAEDGEDGDGDYKIIRDDSRDIPFIISTPDISPGIPEQ